MLCAASAPPPEDALTELLDMVGLLSLAAVELRAAPPPNGPAPLRWLLEPADVLAHRHLDCQEYDQCLDIAVLRPWRSWTCDRCPAFHAAVPAGALRVRLEAGVDRHGTVAGLAHRRLPRGASHRSGGPAR
jgi:hypothetical protein